MIIFGAENYVFLRRKIIAVREQEENILRRKKIYFRRDEQKGERKGGSFAEAGPSG